ncbi:MAG: ATP-binding protein [Bacillota bacterium]
MGKNKVRKRATLKKQFIDSFIMTLVLSLVTAITTIMIFYFIYHQVVDSGSLKINDINIAKILEYSYRNGSTSIDEKNLGELDEIIKKSGMTYYIKDTDNNIIYSSEMNDVSLKHKSYIWNTVTELRSSLFHTPTINIPLIDKNSGEIRYAIVLTHLSNSSFIMLSLIDIGVPFICFLVYTFIFATRISRRIRTPIKELMGAVEKIKSRDVDFSINSSNQDNEISDLAQALEEMRRELKSSLIREWQLEQDRREMVSSITHDLRTPLAIIQGHIEGLQDGIKNDRGKLDAYLEIIEQNTKRAKKLIDDMNLLAEIDSPGFILYSCQVDLNEFIRNKINELRILAAKKEISIETQINDCREENELVSLDHNRLAQVIDNIVGNSIRFTPQKGTIKISVNIEKTGASFRICDTGPGFNEKDLSNIFKKFYKGDTSRSLEKGHSGLGLYITKSIVEKLGGKIFASNLPEEGACIEFSIMFITV